MSHHSNEFIQYGFDQRQSILGLPETEFILFKTDQGFAVEAFYNYELDLGELAQIDDYDSIENVPVMQFPRNWSYEEVRAALRFHHPLSTIMFANDTEEWGAIREKVLQIPDKNDSAF